MIFLVTCSSNNWTNIFIHIIIVGQIDDIIVGQIDDIVVRQINDIVFSQINDIIIRQINDIIGRINDIIFINLYLLM